MLNYIGRKVLITCESWFNAPDGQDYRAVWGTLKAVKEAKEVLGFSPSIRHTNWYIEIGAMIIVGCDVKTLIGCEEKPNTGVNKGWTADAANGIKEYERPSLIYVTD